MKKFLVSVRRIIKKNPLINLINLWGLVFGFVCVIFIALWIKGELSYDSFHKNSKIIYRVHRYFYDLNGTENLHLQYVAPIIAPLLKNEFPEIQYISRVSHTDMVFTSGDQKMTEENVCFADPDILKIFDFEGLPADKNLLLAPFTLIISHDEAMKYFHNNEAIGKNLVFKDYNGKEYSLQVTGIFNTWKGNNHFKPDFFISFSTFESLVGKEELKNWGSNNYETFALIPHLPDGIDTKLDGFIDKNLDYKNASKRTKIRLEKLADIHFNWYTSRSYIYILSSIAFLILFMASINYMNLNAALYSKRLKEIKIRKILGASQNKLAFNLLRESVMFCFFALILALAVVPLISGFVKVTDYTLELKIRENAGLIIGFVVLSGITGLLSGIYPLLILASYKPTTTSSTEYIKTGKTTFRNRLVVFQFIVSTVLIISFLLVSRQLNFINDKDLGIDKENIIVLPATKTLIEKLDVFKQQLAQNPSVLAVSASKRVPSDGLLDSNGANVVSGDSITSLGFRLANVRIDGQFLATYKIKLAAGRNFNENISADSGYLINESAAYKIGWKSPEEAIGRIIDYGGRKGGVIGVVRDFNYESLYNPIMPIIMYYDPARFNKISVRITGTDRNKTLKFIEKIWQSYNVTDYPFTYEYLNDRYNRLYKSVSNMKTIFSYFMFLAISIAILGMVGLSIFFIERRTKEIGIRKVTGARVSEISVMLNKDFLKWVAIAYIIACPISWYAMHKWLQSFAFKTDLSWWIFGLAGILAVGIALITVSWQSWRAATRNPVEALRYE